MNKIVNGVANDYEFPNLYNPNISYSKAYTEQLLIEKDKEIERLSKEVDMWNRKYNEQFNIIDELEKYLEKIIIDGGTRGSMTFWYRQIYEYLKELKEGTNER